MRPLEPDMTVHCRVRNEENFVRAALLSVLPLARRIMVCDTGSTDRTLEEVRSIGSDKIEIVSKPPSDAKGIMEYRNEMIERTATEWFIQVDGDEIYPAHAVRRIIEEMKKIPPGVQRIQLYRKHFINHFNFISPIDRIGRIFRAKDVRWRLFNPSLNEVGHETAYCPSDPSLRLNEHSMTFPEDIFFFHCHYLPRSSKDAELGSLRRWRSKWRRHAFPAFPYFGPWPETLEAKNFVRCMTPQMIAEGIGLNAKLAGLKLYYYLNEKLGKAIRAS